MARKTLMFGAIGTALAAASLIAAPVEAQHYGGGYFQQVSHGSHGNRGWHGGGHHSNRGYYGGGRYSNRGYYGGGGRYYGRHRYRCDRGTGGTIVGAVAGGLLGNAVAGRGDRTLGTVLGAGGGALVGRSLDRGC